MSNFYATGTSLMKYSKLSSLDIKASVKGVNSCFPLFCCHTSSWRKPYHAPLEYHFCFAAARTSHQSRNSASGRSTGCLAGISAHLEVALMWWCVAPSHQSTCNVKEVLPRETFFAGVVTWAAMMSYLEWVNPLPWKMFGWHYSLTVNC